MPTVCGFAGVRLPQPVAGVDLRPAMSNGSVARRFVVSELSEYGKEDRQGRMLRTDRYKYVAFNGGANPEQLFDLELDPGEMQNLARQPSAAPVLREHRDLLRAWGAQTKDDFHA